MASELPDDDEISGDSLGAYGDVDSCFTCRFWWKEFADRRETSDEVFSTCRRYPPARIRPCPTNSTLGELVDPLEFQQPNTCARDWCGEFQPRKNEEKPDPPEQADMSLTYAKFPNRSRQALERRGVTMVSELCALTESDVRGFYLVGDKIIEEIRATLAKLGKSLKGEPPPTSPA